VGVLGSPLGCGGPTNTGSGTTGGPASGGVKRIIILTNGESPFWDACRQGLEAAEKDFGLTGAGLKASLEVNDGTEEGQLARLRQEASHSDIVAVDAAVTKEDYAAIAAQIRQHRGRGVQNINIQCDVNDRRFHAA